MSKKRNVHIFSLCVLFLVALLSACSSGITQESYDSLLSKAASLEAAGQDALTKASSFENVVATLEAVSKEYDQFRESNLAELEALGSEYEAYKKSAEVALEEASIFKNSAEAIIATNESLLNEAVSLLEEAESLINEAEVYKESMSEYEGLASAEAEARRISAEAVIESQAAAESQSIEASKEAASRAAAEESSRKAEEEKHAYDTGITYDQLARTPDQYKGKKVKFTGKVLQVLEDDDEIQIRLAVNSNYDTVLLCAYEPGLVSSRILEDDVITIYGVSVGLFTYTSSFNVPITIPAVWIEKIDQ